MLVLGTAGRTDSPLGLKRSTRKTASRRRKADWSALAVPGTGASRAGEKAEQTVAQSPGWQPPEEFRGLLGRIQVEGRDVGVLWKYQAGLRLANSALADVLRQVGAPPGRMRMELVGLLQVAAPTTAEIVHVGGTRDGGQSALAIDGQLLGEVGGSHPTNKVYRLDLEPGEHRVQWVLLGGDLGTCELQFRDAGQRTALARLPHSGAAGNAARNALSGPADGEYGPELIGPKPWMRCGPGIPGHARSPAATKFPRPRASPSSSSSFVLVLSGALDDEGRGRRRGNLRSLPRNQALAWIIYRGVGLGCASDWWAVASRFAPRQTGPLSRNSG